VFTDRNYFVSPQVHAAIYYNAVARVCGPSSTCHR